MSDYLMTTEEILSDKLLIPARGTLVRRHHDANGTWFADLSFPSMIDAASYVAVNDMDKFCIIVNHAHAFDVRVVVQFAVTAYQIHADAFNRYDRSSAVPREQQYTNALIARRNDARIARRNSAR